MIDLIVFFFFPYFFFFFFFFFLVLIIFFFFFFFFFFFMYLTQHRIASNDSQTEKVLILEFMDAIHLNDLESPEAFGVDKLKLVEEIS
jgi:hypothetical protein